MGLKLTLDGRGVVTDCLRCEYDISRYRRGALIAGAAVLSHWLLDALAHRPDLPLYPGSTVYAGLGLWNSVSGTIIVEVGMFVAGVWLYARRNRSILLWVFVAFLLAIYVANVTGPPPPSARAVALVGLASWILPVWSAWVERRGLFHDCAEGQRSRLHQSK
jgi:hypothetical protein